tara:strand:- start:14945 stop:15295 length:351 start_codon:yes stop_codon:yes gene_type:complete
MRLPRIKSATALLENIFVKETFNQIKRSASYQFVSEITQLTVDDIKDTNEIVSEFGSNVNEITQSGVDYIEDVEEKSNGNVLITMFVRLIVGSFVHYIHDLLSYVYHLIMAFIFLK